MKTSNNNILFRIPRDMFKYHTLTSKYLLVHISLPVIDEIQIKYGLSCNENNCITDTVSDYNKVFVKIFANFTVSLFNNTSITSYNDLDVFACKSGRISIDYTEFCLENNYSQLTIYDFLAKLYTDETIIQPVDEDESSYIYELEIKGNTELQPLVVIDYNHKNTLEELNKKLNKSISNNKFTRGELYSLSALFFSDESDFDFNIINYMPNLEKLYLWYNYFDYIPTEFNNLYNLSKLKVLNLERNNICNLSHKLGNLINLQEIDLCINNISSLPDNFGDLLNLKTVNLYENKLTSLPISIGNLSKLEKLNLRRNRISMLPKEFGNLIKLSELNLNGNNLSTLPEEFSNLINLETLFLLDNNLSSLPKKFMNLSKLQHLDLSYNNFFSLTSQNFNLPNLVALALTGNKLSSLPKNFENLVNLFYLFLDENKFSIVPCQISNLSSLEILCLDKNSISDVSLFKNIKLNMMAAEKQDIDYGTLYEDENKYKLNLNFLKDFNNEIPQIFNISNLGYIESSNNDYFVIWDSSHNNNQVSFEFNSKDELKNYSFNGTVKLILK
ncbi:leucine-rich repeat domain-containing protein [Terrisporobacter sp.]|uniref:leucine-rich repeat domain-containing protein n=1 Tax=Terrisporobacter sp. TaxID=1965305 RepID=UPI002FCA2793